MEKFDYEFRLVELKEEIILKTNNEQNPKTNY